MEALERSNTSARVACSGPNVQFELWIESGQLVHWESQNSLPVEDLLGQEVSSLWMRPLLLENFKSEYKPLNLYELLKILHDSKSEKEQSETEVASNVAAKQISLPPKFEGNLNPVDKDSITGKLKPVLPKPAAAPITKMFSEAAKPKVDEAKEEVAPSTQNIGNWIVFTKGAKETRIVGRAEDCQVTVKDSSASRQHCELYFDGTLIHVKDLNSSNGTRLNGKEIHMAVADDGDQLHIGDVQFILKIDQSLVPGLV